MWVTALYRYRYSTAQTVAENREKYKLLDNVISLGQPVHYYWSI